MNYSMLKVLKLVSIVLILTLASCSSSKKHSSRKTPSHRTKAPIAKKDLTPTPSKSENHDLQAFIKDWEGVPYKYGGTSKSGVDCSGFVGVLYNEVYNKPLPRTTSQLSVATKSVSKNSLRQGDLVFFNINGKKSSHVGVYLNQGDFVHASSSKGVIVSNLESPYYQKNFAKGGRP